MNSNGKYRTTKYKPNLLVKYPSLSSVLLFSVSVFFFLPQVPVPWVCTFFHIMRSCVKNVLKNSHAITNQNLFLRNDPDILKKTKQPKKSVSILNTHVECFSELFVCFCSSSCPAFESRGRDFETKVGSIPRQWHTLKYHLIAHF